jgi:carbon monoxide dehydrogenase subunit G
MREVIVPVDGAGVGVCAAYDGDVQVGGTLAGVGQRLIDATAKMMIKKFFKKPAG